MQKCSSSVGFVVGLGEKFVSKVILEMDDEILTEIRKLLTGQVIPRVMPSYVI